MVNQAVMWKPPSYYDEDYFLRGQSTGVSLLKDYKWLPEVSLRLAMAMIDLASIPRQQPILDYGCATGYLVKALRMLYRDAYGVDHSQWAVENADPAVRDYVRLVREGFRWPFDGMRFHTLIAKDVMEHMREGDVPEMFRRFKTRAKQIVVVVPLGLNDEFYRIPYMELEPDHVVRRDLPWWQQQMEGAGWNVELATHRVEGIKDQWVNYPTGHGILFAK